MPVPLIVHKITLQPQNPAHRRVQILHGYISGQESWVDWCHTHEQALNYLESRLFDYFIRKNGRPLKLVIVQTEDGEKFLKAQSDGENPDALLALPLFTRDQPQPPAKP